MRGGRAFFFFSNDDAVGRGQKWKYARTSATRKTNLRSKRANARIDISFVRNLFSLKEERERKKRTSSPRVVIVFLFLEDAMVQISVREKSRNYGRSRRRRRRLRTRDAQSAVDDGR
jgi:hypothetical protein